MGPFTTTIPLAPAIAWTNPPSTINRSSPLTLTWTGGNSSQTILILGDLQTTQQCIGRVHLSRSGRARDVHRAGEFAHRHHSSRTRHSVPPSNTTTGMVSLMPLQPGNMQFTKLPTGLDVGVAFSTTMTVRTVQVQ